MNQDIELSVVVLCYKAEEHIIPFVEKLKQLLITITDSWQLVLVGNYIPGIPDSTKDVVQQLAQEDQHIKAIAFPKEGMMGWDMKTGLDNADGRYICIIDGDGQFPIESIKKCYDCIKEKQLDFVKTYREQRFDGAYRKLISDGYNILFRLLFNGFDCKDANSKPKIFTREAYQKMDLRATDWFIDAEIMIHVRRHKMKFEELSTVFYDIENRDSFVKVSAILEFIKNLVTYRFQEFFIKK